MEVGAAFLSCMGQSLPGGEDLGEEQHSAAGQRDQDDDNPEQTFRKCAQHGFRPNGHSQAKARNRRGGNMEEPHSLPGRHLPARDGQGKRSADGEGAAKRRSELIAEPRHQLERLIEFEAGDESEDKYRQSDAV